MEPGATYTQMLTQLREHLRSAFKQPTCNWGHKSYSWMNDGLLRQATDCWPGMDGCNRNNAASDACTACDRKNSMCIKCVLQGRVVLTDLSGPREGITKFKLHASEAARRTRFKAADLSTFPSLLTVFKVWRCRFSQLFYRLLPNTFTRSAVKPACFGGLCLCGKSIPQARTIFFFFCLQSVHRGK